MLPLLAVCACEYANFLSYHHKLKKRDVTCAVYFACYPALFVKIFMSWLPLVVPNSGERGEGRGREMFDKDCSTWMLRGLFTNNTIDAH